MIKVLCFITGLFVVTVLSAQHAADPWIQAQLSETQWEATYKGVLADFHPVTIVLASDLNQVAGYLMHDGDDRKHRLLGDWNKTQHFQLQERDENDRLTGYLSGTVTDDQLRMEWMSADQSRMFEIKAYPQSLIKIKSFNPLAEWIEVASTPKLTISVQKMEYGIVTGIANRNGQYSRFEGYCLDGSCSLWNTILQNPTGAPVKVQMRQKDAVSYKATLDGMDYVGSIIGVTPLVIRKFDNSMGFLDFVYPDFESASFKTWLTGWLDPKWNDGMAYLKSINQPGQAGRLVHRSSGWIEIVEDTPVFTSGIMTYINPGATSRIPFVLLKKEDILLSMEDLLNATEDLKKASQEALKTVKAGEDPGYRDWLNKAGYISVLPTVSGVVATTEFNMIYGDDLQLLSLATSREIVKKRYWKYFGW